MSKIFLAAILIVSMASEAAAAHWEKGNQAYGQHDYATAVKEWTAGDAESDAESTFELSVAYRDGEGVTQDLTKSAQLLSKAANQGLARAQFNLANYYRETKNVPPDYVAMRRWYLAAAQQYSFKAMHSYATALLQGLGGPVDKVGAVAWFDRAIYFGDRDPYYAHLIDEGTLPRPDYASLLKQRTGLAKAGNMDAQFELAFMYALGRGTKTDSKQAARWFQAAADQGHSTAQFYLGTQYRDGTIGARDDVKAAMWFRKSALQGNAYAQSTLGLAYFLGIGVERNRILGAALMIVGTFHGDEDALQPRMMASGKMPPDDLEAARALAQKCLTQGMASCLP